MASGKKRGNTTLIFLCCLLGIPTAEMLLPGVVAESTQQAVLAGALLGFAHLLIRPVLRVLSAPIGCLTLGLFGLVIDVGLLYACTGFVDGFTITSWPQAILAAILINSLCGMVGRKA